MRLHYNQDLCTDEAQGLLGTHVYTIINKSYYRLDTTPSGRVFVYKPDDDLEGAMAEQSIDLHYNSLEELKKEGHEIHRTIDGLSVGDVVVRNGTSDEYTVIHRSGYSDMSLVVLSKIVGITDGVRSNYTLQEAKAMFTLKIPTPERCKACGR